MGNKPSVPVPGTKLLVIGAGLPRTGTASFSEALRILLDGPVYHGGTQATLGSEHEIRSWITLLDHFPARNAEDRKLVTSIVRERLDGYVAACDSPVNGLVLEMMELYPEAKVVCTVRDPVAWVKSMESVQNAATLSFLRFILFPIPGMRFFPDYIVGLRNQWLSLFGEADPVTVQLYQKHIEGLKRLVPKDKLLFFDVKDGWGPLCTALGKDIPKDIPFPKINDGEAIQRLTKRMLMKGLVRWVITVCTLGLALIPYVILKW